MKALVLSGGGALGAYEAGAISALCKAFAYDLVCGTSIGALNASYVAQNRLPELEKTWNTIGSKNVITLIPSAQNLRLLANAVIAFQAANPLKKIASLPGLLSTYKRIGSFGSLMKLLGALSPDPIAEILKANIDFSRLAIPLIVSGTNLSTGKSDAFYWFPTAQQGQDFEAKHDKGLAHPLSATNILDAVRASSAIPFAFAPVSIAATSFGALAFVDGGVANNTPLGVAIDAGADDITVIFLNPPDHHAPQAVNNLAEVGLTCFSIMQERILELDFQNAMRVNRAIAQSAGGTGSAGPRRAIDLKQIRPAQTLPITVLQFDRQELIDKVYGMGVADAQAAMASW